MLHFIIGTEAELIKILPVFCHLKKQGIDYHFIATGQNNIFNSYLYDLFGLKQPDVVLDSGKPILTPLSMLWWFLCRLAVSLFRLNRIFKNDLKGIVVVHGDTVSTFLGALLGVLSGKKVAHIESGLRSWNLFDPFPEEICRRLVSRIADVNFCPGEWALNNLKKCNKVKINTRHNTLLDTLRLTLSLDHGERLSTQVPDEFFIFSLHRQENVFNRKKLKFLLESVLELAEKIQCLFILFSMTKKAIIDIGMYDQIARHPRIIVAARLEYPDFIQLLQRSRFIITDGGSNQEEAYYLGTPCLILRKRTERVEGLNSNCLLSGLDIELIKKFAANYTAYRQSPVEYRDSPSQTIVEELTRAA